MRLYLTRILAIDFLHYKDQVYSLTFYTKLQKSIGYKEENTQKSNINSFWRRMLT